MEKDKEYLEKWNQRIAGMSLEELLQIVIDEHDYCYPEFLRMARHKLYNDYRIIKQLYSNDEQLNNDEKRKMSYDPSEHIEALDLLRCVLEEIGCRFEERNEDEICFNYEGERFFAYVSFFDNIVTIFDGWEEMCDLDEEQYIGLVKEAINNTNQNTFETFFYGTDEASNTFAVRSSRNVYLTPKNPELGNYIRSVLESFFRARRFFENEMERLWKTQNNKE